jgi:hypothetical protein
MTSYLSFEEHIINSSDFETMQAANRKYAVVLIVIDATCLPMALICQENIEEIDR